MRIRPDPNPHHCSDWGWYIYSLSFLIQLSVIRAYLSSKPYIVHPREIYIAPSLPYISYSFPFPLFLSSFLLFASFLLSSFLPSYFPLSFLLELGRIVIFSYPSDNGQLVILKTGYPLSVIRYPLSVIRKKDKSF